MSARDLTPLATVMCSIDIVDVINEEREEGAAVMRHDNFMAKIEKHPGIQSPKFLGDYKDARGRMQKCYFLPKREAELMVMSESLAVQTRVYDRLVALEGGALPSAAPTQRPLDIATQALKLAPLAMRAARAFGLDITAAAISANQYVCAVTGQNLLKAFGQTHLEAENQEAKYFTPTNLGKRIGLNGRKFNDRLAAAGFQAKQGGEWELTATGRAFGRIFDTGKNHDSGVPVQQIKWAANVIDALPPILGGGQASLI